MWCGNARTTPSPTFRQALLLLLRPPRPLLLLLLLYGLEKLKAFNSTFLEAAATATVVVVVVAVASFVFIQYGSQTFVVERKPCML
jgi:hypothetical protein